MHRATASLLPLLTALALACSEPTAKAPAAPPAPAGAEAPLVCRDCNLVVISLTATRKDHLGLFGYGRRTSPNIDAFFADAFKLERAFAPASWTLPVAGSIFTGLYPYRHGLMDRAEGSRLPDEAVTLAEVLHDAGFRTAAITGGGDYNRRFNLSQGFGDYIDERNYQQLGIGLADDSGRSPRPAYLGLEALLPHAEDWLENHARERFFLFLQGYDAHCPFSPRPPFARAFDPDYPGHVDFSSCMWTVGPTRPEKGDEEGALTVHLSTPGDPTVTLTPRDLEHMVALYDGEILQVDAALAGLFGTVRRLGLVDKTVFVLMAEHGELFGEHGRIMRGGPLFGTFYDPVLAMPLAIKHPRAKGGAGITSLVQAVDLLPTLLDLVGVDDPARAERQGQSFLGLLQDPARRIHEVVFAGARYAACQSPLFSGMSVVEMARSASFKLVREEEWDTNSGLRTSSHETLFDLEQDPAEEHDRAGARPEIAADLRAQLDARFPERSANARAATCKGKNKEAP